VGDKTFNINLVLNIIFLGKDLYCDFINHDAGGQWRVILIDTANQEDININQKILETTFANVDSTDWDTVQLGVFN